MIGTPLTSRNYLGSPAEFIRLPTPPAKMTAMFMAQFLFFAREKPLSARSRKISQIRSQAVPSP